MACIAVNLGYFFTFVISLVHDILLLWLLCILLDGQPLLIMHGVSRVIHSPFLGI